MEFLRKYRIYFGLFIFLCIGTFLFLCYRDSNEEVVVIGSQTWQQHELSVRTFRNGDSILFVTNEKDRLKASQKDIAICCYPYFDSAKSEELGLGLLYNWYAVNDKRGLAPKGYRIPSKKDWQILIDFGGGWRVAGDKLRSNDDWKWNPRALKPDRVNETGFAAKCGGTGLENFDQNFGHFANWWTSDSSLEVTRARGIEEYLSAYIVGMDFRYPFCQIYLGTKSNPASVRCIKN